MSVAEREQGRTWVEREIVRIADKRGVTLSEPLRWHEDFDHRVHWVEATFDGNIKSWKFTYESLEDCIGDKYVRRELENAIGFFVPSEGSKVVVRQGQQSIPPAEPPNTSMQRRMLSVFLCHSRLDKPAVRDLYGRLKTRGISPWFDEEDLLPGQDWELMIKKAVRGTDVVLVCISEASVTTRGFAQKEIKLALDVADEQPEGTIFIVPIKLDECEIPDRLKRWHWVNLFETNGFGKLMAALQHRATELGIGFKLQDTLLTKKPAQPDAGAKAPAEPTRSRVEEESTETQRTFSSSAYFAPEEVLAPEGYNLAYRTRTLCYLRLIPPALRTPIELATLKDEVLSAPLLRDGRYSSVLHGLNRYGAITCTFTELSLTASTQLFQNGEIWCISSSLIRTDRECVPEYIKLPCLSAFVLEQAYYDTLQRLTEFATSKLRLEPVWDVEMGLTGVSGLFLNWENNPFSPQVGPVHKTEIVYRSSLGEVISPTLDEVLLYFFSRVFDSVGERRPSSLYGFPPNRPG